MSFSCENFNNDGSNSSFNSSYDGTDLGCFSMTSVLDFIIVPFDLLINSYVIWLIVTGTGNGLAAECFSLNHSMCEIILCVESLVNPFIYVENLYIFVLFFDGFTITGRPLFQCLICVERYLAVIHPVIFLKYKPLRYRVTCSFVVWVASLVSGGFNFIPSLYNLVYFVSLFVQFLIFFSIQLFCLVAVLRALKQSGPGERKEEEHPTKRRAFYVILITTVTMLIMYAPYITVVAIFSSGRGPEYITSIGFVCFTFAGLVQPVLFLYRVRKLPFIKDQ